MQERGWFIDQNKSLVHESEVGVSPESMGRRATRPPGTRTPITRTRIPLRKIGSSPAGVLGDIKTWWIGLKPEYRWGAFGAAALVGVIIAACQKGKGKDSSLKKI